MNAVEGVGPGDRDGHAGAGVPSATLRLAAMEVATIVALSVAVTASEVPPTGDPGRAKRSRDW